MINTIKLTSRGLKRLQTGHPWIYRDDLESGADAKINGEIVRVESRSGTFLAQAFYSYRSSISLRIISATEAPVDREFFKNLIVGAKKRRAGLFSKKKACRVVSAEGDLFPGLIADYYAGHLSVQILIPAVEKLKPILLEILDEIFAPETITFRGDVSVREMEGLPLHKEMLKGEPQNAVVVEEGDVRYSADLWNGHKTGGYLDQQANRISIGALAKGRALDAFCYQGHFSIHLAKRCDEVIALDSSEPALERLKENCALNGLDNVIARKANVFDELGKLHSGGEKFDTIILDPPPFARSRKDVNAAMKGYRELNRRALSLLNAGGRLATYSCSYNISTEIFLDVLRHAAADARRKVAIVEYQTQSPDHPILLNAPETQYLKGFALETLD